ncbi:cold-shock protein [Paractinoplanes lichenicola]|uniref:Cold shock domain-containing protein n=1 Tax=Paractinoplanes lichenicola TaxID=2802976 RepID=A0ABS1W0B1_9ACTN|nr:cold shock domain-containing protein [Actinoplanes lichenicola]
MSSVGTVRTFDVDEGWGVIDGPDVPGGCWVHFSVLAMDGFRMLTPGQPVTFTAEAAQQDGFAFRALKVWTGPDEPVDAPIPAASSGAYESRLTLTFDPPHPDDGTE